MDQGSDKAWKTLRLTFLAALPPREQIVVKEYVTNGWHQTKAMLAAGYSVATANKQQWRVFDRPRVKKALAEIEYKQHGPEWMNNEELKLIGLDVRHVRQQERRAKEKAEETEDLDWTKIRIRL